eukprot:2029049-Prymnesium_polylepis.1
MALLYSQEQHTSHRPPARTERHWSVPVCVRQRAFVSGIDARLGAGCIQVHIPLSHTSIPYHSNSIQKSPTGSTGKATSAQKRF